MENLTKILAVGIGGAFGAIARYLINISPLSNIFQKFPFPTFTVNILGSFLIGFLLVLFTDKYTAHENLRIAVLLGFIGAFTTFSTFELEIFELIRGKNFVIAFAYLFLSVLVGFIGVAGGVWLAKRI
ncbi:MAG: fluoride efflux transporter CrcB [Acidobacteriota bacterium]